MGKKNIGSEKQKTERPGKMNQQQKQKKKKKRKKRKEKKKKPLNKLKK